MKTFKIGDKVKIIKNTSSSSGQSEYIGKVGYIKRVENRDLYPYLVKTVTEENIDNLSWWKASELELVKKKVKPTKCKGCGLPMDKSLGMVNRKGELVCNVCGSEVKPTKEKKFFGFIPNKENGYPTMDKTTLTPSERKTQCIHDWRQLITEHNWRQLITEHNTISYTRSSNVGGGVGYITIPAHIFYCTKCLVIKHLKN